MSIEKWTASQIGDSLANVEAGRNIEHDIAVQIYDSNTRSFCGIDSNGFFVFGAPQFTEFEGFFFARAKLEGNKSLLLSNGVSVSPVFTFSFLASNQEEIKAISTIFAGLQNQICDIGDSSTAQISAKGFEDYFARIGRLRVSRDLQIGLFGELAFILSSTQKELIVQGWHSSPFSTYDFGVKEGRLEVKSSTAPTRLHWLRSSQSVNLDRSKLTYLSIFVPEVAGGTSIQQLRQKILEGLSENTREIFEEKIGLFDLDGCDMTFDLDSALGSFKFVSALDVPIVTSSEASVTQISWRCNFSLLQGEQEHSIWS